MKSSKKLENIIHQAMQYYAASKTPSTITPVFPEHIHIEPTNACNLRCVHCHHSSPGTHFTKKTGMMDFDLYKKIIDQIKDSSEQITLDSQGEPTNHPRFYDMVEYAKKAGLAVNVLTNATQLDNELSDKLIAIGLNRIVFSFDGSNAEVYEAVRRKSNYYSTLRNILNFMKCNHEAGHHTFVTLSMVKHSYTEKDIKPYQEYFGSLPVDAVFISPLFNLAGGSPLADERTVEALNVESANISRVCRVPWMNMSIGWDGQVCPCPLDYNEAHPVGDTNTQSLSDILNGEKMQKFRQCHLDHDYDWIEEQGALCASCNALFDPEYSEYDYLDMDEFLTRHIVRQAKVHLQENDTHVKQDDDFKKDSHYLKVVDELNRVEALLNAGENKREIPAKKLKAAELRETAIQGSIEVRLS